MHKFVTGGEAVLGAAALAGARNASDGRLADDIDLTSNQGKSASHTHVLNIPISASFAAERRAKLSQLKHRLRWGRQQISRPDVGIIGGYHHGNLGDMAMGYAVARRIASKKYSWGLQTVYNLERWPSTRAAIVGGGAVGYSACLQQLAEKYGRTPQRTAILGVDFNDPSALRPHAAFLKNVALITCRSANQATSLAEALERVDISWHPDLCFSLYDHTDEKLSSTRDSEHILGINCVPLFLKKSGRRFVPGTNYLDEMKRETSGLIRHIDKLSVLYSELVCRICAQAKRAGLRIRHIPFTPIDDMFARVALQGLGVEFLPYTSNVSTVLARVGQCHQFFTTRFHSLVFSLLKHCVVTPFCYASKCDRLLQDFGISNASIIRLPDLLEPLNAIVERVIEGQGLRVPASEIKVARDRVSQVVDTTIETVTMYE